MNILFFLTPKSQTAYAQASDSVRQVAEKLDFHKYTTIPILDDEGRYVDTVSDGDLFWFVKKYYSLNFQQSEEINILEVPHRRTYQSIRYDASMEELVNLAMSQNFVPVLDDHNVFMGIITRKAIIRYFAQQRVEK